MKGCIVALLIIVLLISAVAGNAAYVHHVTEVLMEGLESLPGEIDPAQTPAAGATVREGFERHVPLLSLTVPYTVLDRVIESLWLLEIQAAEGDALHYASTLALHKTLAKEIARLERLSVENLL